MVEKSYFYAIKMIGNFLDYIFYQKYIVLRWKYSMYNPITTLLDEASFPEGPIQFRHYLTLYKYDLNFENILN